MRLGVALPQYGYSVAGEEPPRWDTVLAWANRAEELGFDSIWLSDHLFLGIERYGGPANRRYATFEPLVTLGALARETSRVRLGTLVLCAHLRNVAALANALSALDHVSEGRLVVGMGAGWFEHEYEAAGIPFGPPSARLADLAGVLDELRSWFTGSGGILPPVQDPAPPLWVGGKGGSLVLDVVARHADGWNTVWVWTPEAYEERLDALDAACERAGRDPAGVTRSLGLYALAGESTADLEGRFRRLQQRTPPGVLDGITLDEWRQGRLVGTVDEVRAQADRWRGLGVDELIVCPGALPFHVSDLEDLEILATALQTTSDPRADARSEPTQ